MRLPSGQPLLQNGTPQSSQRAAWMRTCSGAGSSWTSCQSRTRSSTGRCGVSLRPYSRNPVTLPITRPRVDARLERQLQVAREYLDEARREIVPLAQHLLRALAARQLEVPSHHALEDFLVFRRELLQIDPLGVDARRERPVEVQ